MAEAILSPLVELLLQNLTSQVTNVFQLVKGADEEVEKLTRTLGRIQALLTDAERKEVTEETVRLWIKDLRDVAYDAEDVLDKFATKSLLLRSYKDNHDQVDEDARQSSSQEQQVCCYFSSPYRSFKQAKLRYSTVMKIKGIRERLDEISNEEFALKASDQGTKAVYKKIKAEWRQTDSFVDESETYGRDEDKRKIIQMLLGSESSSTPVNHHHPHVVAVVGLGGLGKTTLAKLVYNDASIIDCFELRMWVCVSDDFGVKRLIRMIIESISKEALSSDLAMEALQYQLRDKINGRRYLLVLDDVWDDDQDRWDTVHLALKCGAEGSSIIVTTRNNNVAKVRGAYSHCLMGLSDDYCFALFKKRAFENEIERPTYPNLEQIGREIVKKCGGVPLAAKALGSLMFNKRDVNEWVYVRDSQIWTLPAECQKGILPALRLSYNCLPPHLKQCFVYCAIFPKDCRLEKKTLIQLWAAEGFIQSPNDTRSLQDIGNEYFNELLWRSFFQDVEKDEYGDIGYCKMHDLNHDLAQSIAGEEYFDLSSPGKATISKQVRHLSFGSMGVDQVRYGEIPNAANKVRTLVCSKFSHAIYAPTPLCLILSLKFLRALTLCCSLKELPSSICTLIHLRYLHFVDSRACKLPKNVINLRNLQTLKLPSNLKELPQNMSYLKKLIHVEIYDGASLKKMPANIGQLKFLQTLSLFIVGKESGCGIGELCRLDLHGSMRICNLENVTNSQKAKEAKLGEKPHLRALKLSWSEVKTSGSEDGVKYSRDVQVEVLEGLQPHPNLQSLRIDNYAGVQIPKWLMDCMLPNLTHIELYSCKRVEVLPPFSKLQFLQSLVLEYMDSVKKILDIVGFHQGSSSNNNSTNSCTGGYSYPKLKRLKLLHLPCLEGITTPMPCLEDLVCIRCPKLSLSLLNLPSLHSLIIHRTHNEILSSIAGLTSVAYLTIGTFEEVEFLSRDIFQHHSVLQGLIISNFPKLRYLHSELLANLTSLKSLKIMNCDALTSLSSLKMDGLTSLQQFDIYRCSKLTTLPEGVHHLPNLTKICIDGCDALTSLFSVTTIRGCFPSLQRLQVANCKELTCLWAANLPKVRGLSSEQEKEEDVELQSLPNLEWLQIEGCDKLGELPEWLGNCQRLRKLEIEECNSLRSLPDSLNAPPLKYLCIERCKELRSLPATLKQLPLDDLDIIGCPMLE